MSNREGYIQRKLRAAWWFLAAGVILFAGGLALQLWGNVHFNARIVSGLGIVMAGVGVALRVRYHEAVKDETAAKRIANEERDERSLMIRRKAGTRGFWVSIVMTYILLMWLSLASNGSLPMPSADTIWFYLSAAVVTPLLVFITSIVLGEKNS